GGGVPGRQHGQRGEQRHETTTSKLHRPDLHIAHRSYRMGTGRQAFAAAPAIRYPPAMEAAAELRADVHSVRPVPEAERDSTGPQQMWIWAGANTAPINWALGALGIVLELGLAETIAVIVAGNLVGCAIFAAFTTMGHATGVNQMVLSRSAFGRR